MANINIKIDDNVNAQAQKLFDSLGMDMDTAVGIFLRQAIDFDGIPFSIENRRYNAETEQAIRDAHAGIGLSKPYNSIEELKEALHADD